MREWGRCVCGGGGGMRACVCVCLCVCSACASSDHVFTVVADDDIVALPSLRHLSLSPCCVLRALGECRRLSFVCFFSQHTRASHAIISHSRTPSATDAPDKSYSLHLARSFSHAERAAKPPPPADAAVAPVAAMSKRKGTRLDNVLAKFQ